MGSDWHFCLQLKHRAGITLPSDLYDSLKCYLHLHTSYYLLFMVCGGNSLYR